MVFIAWLLSKNRKAIDWRLVGVGIVLQIIFAVLVLLTEPGRMFFDGARIIVDQLIGFSDEGAKMVFGEKFRDHYFAFSVLPTIIFFSSLMSLGFYSGVVQKVVEAMSWIMVKLMNVSGTESLASAGNVFLGQTEAALIIKPYISTMTRSEIMALMVGGMANVAGGVLAAYVSFGIDAGHLLAASIMSAPASLVIAKMLMPETEESNTKGHVRVAIEKQDENVIDAACRGASEGLLLAANVAAMLIAFVALAAALNYFLGLLPHLNGEALSFERILSWLFAPLAWVMGVDSSDIFAVGRLLGKKMFLNEFVAYLDLKELKGQISERSFVITTYALCGFANFSSIAIQIGGIGALVPSRRKDLAQLGFWAMIGGTLSTFMAACIAGVLI